MGNFGGHALPGSFFIIFSLWWTIQIYKRYFQSLAKHGGPFKSTATYNSNCLCGRLKTWEVEGMLLIFFTTVGFSLEIITAFHDGHFAYLGNGQHATMFFFFGLSGLINILVHHRVPLPKNIEYASMALAFSVEGLLFKFHLHGRTDLDVLLHTLLLYAILGCIVSILLEMKYRGSVLAALCRAFFVGVQGTWFWQVGFILYNPIPNAKPWDHEDHEQMMVATMMFAWHFAAIFIGMLLIGGLIGCFYKSRGYLPSSGEFDPMQMKLIKKDVNGHTIVNLHDDSDSDIEFDRLQPTVTQ